VDAAEELKKHIEFRAPGGDTFSLAFTGPSPSQARDVTARLAEMVLAEDADLRRKQAVALRDFLEAERRTTADELRGTEVALASFMAAHPKFALDTTPFATGAAVRATLGPQGTPSRMRPSIEATGAVRQVRSADALRLDAGVPATANPVASAEIPSATREAVAEEARARAALDAAQTNLAVLGARFTPAHPDVRAAQVEVERASSQLNMARAALAAAESHDLGALGSGRAVPPPVAAPRVETSPHHVLVHRSTSAAAVTEPSPLPRASEEELVTLETEWVRLTRAATEARRQQDQVEAALFKASSAAQEQTRGGVQVTIIDPAFLPETPVPPGRAVIVALFAAGALLLASLASLMAALLDDHVYEARDVDPLLPVLVAIPRRRHGSSR
jgi:hypothetical protein